MLPKMWHIWLYLQILCDSKVSRTITLSSSTSSWWMFFMMWQKTKRQNSYAIKKDKKKHIVWNMCFKRSVLNVCSLSVALNENGNLLCLVETTWVRLSSGIKVKLYFLSVRPFVSPFLSLSCPRSVIGLSSLVLFVFLLSHNVFVMP